MNHARRLAIASLVSLGAFAAAGAFAAWRTVEGSGTVVTQHRDATGMSRIAIGGDFEVEIRQGTQEGIELTGDDNILPLIETRVEGPADARVLSIGSRDNVDWSSKRPIKVRIDLKTLSELELGGSSRIVSTGLRTKRLDVSIGGSGAVSLPGLDTDHLDVSIGGSGRMGADGRADAVAVSIGGSGSCELAQLAGRDVSVSIGGSGSARVNAAQSLNASIAGSGRVQYTGAATPSVQVVGSGRVDRI